MLKMPWLPTSVNFIGFAQNIVFINLCFEAFNHAWRINIDRMIFRYTVFRELTPGGCRLYEI